MLTKILEHKNNSEEVLDKIIKPANSKVVMGNLVSTPMPNNNGIQ